MKHLRHRQQHFQEDGGADINNEKEHRHNDLNLQKDTKEHPPHHHHYSNIASFFRQRIVTQTTKRRIPKELTISQEWILRLLISSLFLFVLSFMILIVWLILFPQDSPNNTHIEIFFLRNNNNRAANGKDNVVLAPQLPSLDNIKVSVVIMNHNRPRLLQQSQLLPTLIAHPNVDEILLAHSNPATQFDYYKDYYVATASNNQTTTTIRSSNNNKIVNINATQANQDMGLSLRFHYCAQQARNEFVMMVDDDQEMTLDAISRLILEFSVSDNNSSSSTLNDGNDNDNENNNNNMPYNPHRIVGRYGRVYHEDSTWWSWYHVANHGYDTRTYTGRVEVVLTKFMILHRSTCQAFFDYQHLVWNDLIQPHRQESKPLWNGEDIFMSLVANHLYQKHQLQQQQQQQSHKGIIPYNHYATSSLHVWEAPVVDELDTDTTDTTAVTTTTTGGGNSKTGISGNMDRHVLFWNVGWTEYWQIKARARDHIHYRGLLWFTARQRLAALLQQVVPSQEEVKSSS